MYGRETEVESPRQRKREGRCQERQIKKLSDQYRDKVTVGTIMRKLGTDRLREWQGKEKLFGFHRGESLAHRGEQRPGQLGTPVQLSLLSKKSGRKERRLAVT